MSARTPRRPHLPLVLALLGAACSGESPGDDASTTAVTTATSTSAGSAGTSGGSTGGSMSGSTSGSSESTSGSTTLSTASTTLSTSASTTMSTTMSTSASTSGSTSEGGASGFCQELCEADEDCQIGGADQKYSCESGHCVKASNSVSLCHDDDVCQIGVLSLYTLCSTNDECGGTELCAVIDGYAEPGVCAGAPNAMGECANELWEKRSVPLVEGGEGDVCAIAEAACDPVFGEPLVAFCALPAKCTSDDGCASAGSEWGQPKCVAGLCVCTEDAHCADVPNTSRCVAGSCVCVDDDDCPGVPGVDTCVDGACGCASDRACPGEPNFDGTEIVCASK